MEPVRFGDAHGRPRAVRSVPGCLRRNHVDGVVFEFRFSLCLCPCSRGSCVLSCIQVHFSFSPLLQATGPFPLFIHTKPFQILPYSHSSFFKASHIVSVSTPITKFISLRLSNLSFLRSQPSFRFLISLCSFSSLFFSSFPFVPYRSSFVSVNQSKNQRISQHHFIRYPIFRLKYQIFQSFFSTFMQFPSFHSFHSSALRRSTVRERLHISTLWMSYLRMSMYVGLA